MRPAVWGAALVHGSELEDRSPAPQSGDHSTLATTGLGLHHHHATEPRAMPNAVHRSLRNASTGEIRVARAAGI